MLSLQVSDELYKEFERVREEAGYQSRSVAIREAISAFIDNFSNMDQMRGHIVCTVNITFPIKEDVLNELSEISANNVELIRSTSDLRLETVGLRVYILSGDAQEISDFVKLLSSNRRYRTTVSKIIFDENIEAISDNEE